ncbi:hypothetical protein MG293_010532 [Ovis ammon polii]|uniref:Uncharacterized protein n=1 Tax=Ovis ammon polii TaxID=230172 RepID=A0AAD4Y637_OVIAM|nr:hypothetical protein MG293_010532 [Ovis ammon polii]
MEVHCRSLVDGKKEHEAVKVKTEPSVGEMKLSEVKRCEYIPYQESENKAKNRSMLHTFFCGRTHYPEGAQTLYCQDIKFLKDYGIDCVICNMGISLFSMICLATNSMTKVNLRKIVFTARSVLVDGAGLVLAHLFASPFKLGSNSTLL